MNPRLGSDWASTSVLAASAGGGRRTVFAKHPHLSFPICHRKHPASTLRPCGLSPSFFPNSMWPSWHQAGRLGPEDKNPRPFHSPLFKTRLWPVGYQGSQAWPRPTMFREGTGKKETCIEHLLYAWQVLPRERLDTKCLILGPGSLQGMDIPPLSLPFKDTLTGDPA